MRVGVVISTSGRETLRETLAALAVQPYDMLTVVRDYRGNVSRARNEAWRSLAANCDVIAFTDDDCIPDADWIAEGKKFFEQNPKLSIMQGKVYGGFETGPKFMFVTANMWVKVGALQEVNGFDEGYVYVGNEDIDLGWSLLDRGRQALFNDKCRVYHPTKPQHLILPQNAARTMSKFPERYLKLTNEDSSI